MAHTDTVFSIMERVGIATKHQVGDIMASWGIWAEKVSTVNNSYRELNNLDAERRIVKENGFFRMPNIKGEFAEHSRLLTQSLVEVLKFNRDSLIKREHTISSVGLRPDSLILLKHNNQRAFIWFEQVHKEKPDYLQSKKNALNNWQDAKSYMSELFGEQIKRIDFVTSDELSSYLSELNNLEEK